MVPTGFARLWITEDSNFGTLATTQLASAAHCQSPANNSFSFWTDYGFSAKEFSCVDPVPFGDGELVPNAGSAELYVPFYFGEEWYERATTGGDCTTLASACNDAANYDLGVPGAKKYFDDGGSPCECKRIPTHHFTVGVEKLKINMDHKMSVEDTFGQFTVGYASKSKKAAADGGYVPLLSVIMSYDQEEKIWKEHNCNQWGNCRFDGQTISMTVEQWMSAAGVTNLDNLNPYGGTNQQTSYTPNGGTAAALASKPSYRLSGFQIIVQLEYLDVNYHTLSDYNDSGTEKSFPGTVCYMKI
jgi:hypothetical protein